MHCEIKMQLSPQIKSWSNYTGNKIGSGYYTQENRRHKEED